MASVWTLLLFGWPLLMVIIADQGEVVKQVLACNKENLAELQAKW